VRAIGDRSSELETLIRARADQYAILENEDHRLMKKFAESDPICRWMISNMGIGDILAVGIRASFDIEQGKTDGAWWKYAGIIPATELKYGPGEKRPFSAFAKQQMYHLGECMVKVSNNPDAFYGRIYREIKAQVVARDEAGCNAERAKTFFTKSAEWKKVLKTGHLPPGHLDTQAKRRMAKVFLSHLRLIMHWHDGALCDRDQKACALDGSAERRYVPGLA
jgi:hypothetical protein